MKFETMKEAKAYLRENWEKGIECPCCGQFVKLYSRSITSSMAYALYLIYKNQKNDDWTHVQSYLKKLNIPAPVMSGDISKLKFWELLEVLEGERKDGSKRVGFYRVTEKGKEFIHGRISVPKHCKLYNQKFYGFSGEQIHFKDALGKNFNYDDLMAGL